MERTFAWLGGFRRLLVRWELDRKNPHRGGVDEFDTCLNSVGKENNGETNACR